MSRNSLKNITQLIKQANDELPIEQCFLNDLKRTIELTEQKNSRPPSKTYKPSSMNCIRNMYYQVIGADREESPVGYALVGICNSGTDIHERTQKYIDGMKENGVDCEYINVAEYVKSRNLSGIEIVEQKGMETKLYHKRLNMSFMCDGIIRYKGKYYIVELKTETSYKWVSRKGVDQGHYNQAIAYSTAFGINKVLFIYISRDTLDMKSYMFNVTDEMCKSFIERIEACDSYVNKHETPPKPAELNKKACYYCPYKTQCERDK